MIAFRSGTSWVSLFGVLAGGSAPGSPAVATEVNTRKSQKKLSEKARCLGTLGLQASSDESGTAR